MIDLDTDLLVDEQARLVSAGTAQTPVATVNDRSSPSQRSGRETGAVSKSVPLDDVLEQLDLAGTANRWPVVPGYEILGELGRGSMGVVYKARQRSLQRVVALKMIRADVQASRDELQRFVSEARVLASLQHPNIVQLFEVNLQQNSPYFLHGVGERRHVGGSAQRATAAVSADRAARADVGSRRSCRALEGDRASRSEAGQRLDCSIRNEQRARPPADSRVGAAAAGLLFGHAEDHRLRSGQAVA